MRLKPWYAYEHSTHLSKRMRRTPSSRRWAGVQYSRKQRTAARHTCGKASPARRPFEYLLAPSLFSLRAPSAARVHHHQGVSPASNPVRASFSLQAPPHLHHASCRGRITGERSVSGSLAVRCHRVVGRRPRPSRSFSEDGYLLHQDKCASMGRRPTQSGRGGQGQM